MTAATLLGSAVAGVNGTWSFATAALTDGNHSFTATATDGSGNTSAASTVDEAIVDTVAPVTPTIALQSVDSGIAGDDITNVKVVSLTGGAEINSTIKVYDGATLLGSATANAEGVWNFVADLSDDQMPAQAGAGQTATARCGCRCRQPEPGLGLYHRAPAGRRAQLHGDLNRLRRQRQLPHRPHSQSPSIRSRPMRRPLRRSRPTAGWRATTSPMTIR